ncbi:MAG TPA: pyridoxal-phosphate dependent enzyme [Anaerolineaceae bacterium]|nr:pyridoxal-phosphate dependent enzyme [Anaerolineaceae bacterium]
MSLSNLTPVFESIPMGYPIGKKVLLKMECFQEAGSFKIRGVGKVCELLKRQGCQRYVCPSGGNAGFAVAWAGRKLGVRSTIVMPEGASIEAQDAIRMLDGEVIVHGETWYQSNDLAMEIAGQEMFTEYVSPYENPVLWTGYSTMVDEIVNQCEKPDAIVLSIGGGGLMCGLIEGLDRHHWGDIPIIGCGTFGANAFAASMEADKLIRLDRVTSMVTCISAEVITEKVMEYRRNHHLIPYLTTDYAAMCACERFLDDHRVLVDPACGVALSAVYSNSSILGDAQSILVIVCGGVGVKQEKLEIWKRQAAANLEKEMQ